MDNEHKNYYLDENPIGKISLTGQYSVFLKPNLNRGGSIILNDHINNIGNIKTVKKKKTLPKNIYDENEHYSDDGCLTDLEDDHEKEEKDLSWFIFFFQLIFNVYFLFILVKKKEDVYGNNVYLKSCKKLRIKPLKNVCKSLKTKELSITRRGLNSHHILAICNALVVK